MMVPEVDEKAPGDRRPVVGARSSTSTRRTPSSPRASSSAGSASFTGCFDTVITDEEERINLNKLDAPLLSAQVLLAQLVTTLSDKKYEFLFEKEDSNKVKVTPNERHRQPARLGRRGRDGQPAELHRARASPSSRASRTRTATTRSTTPRYRAKNARFDSFDELYLVHGVNDRFMAAFKDKLTVYPDVNSRLNINTDDPMLLELAIRTVADPTQPDPRLADPIFIDTLIKKIRAARMFALFGMSAARLRQHRRGGRGGR